MRPSAEAARRSRWIVVYLFALALAGFPGAVAAWGEIDIDVSKDGERRGGGAPSGDPKPTGGCSWVRSRGTAENRSNLLWLLQHVDGGELLEYHSIHYTDGQLRYTILETGTTFGLQIYECWGDRRGDPHEGRARYDEVGPPDPVVLLPALYDRAVAHIYPPVPSLNPATDMYINLGLWLAIEPPDPHPVIARAEIPGAWAEARATVISTTFDLGNGDSVTCTPANGGIFGTPLPASQHDTIDQGPCGYTYNTVDDIGELTITITTTWMVEETTSTGYYRRRNDITESTTVAAHVYEIQTVGR